MSRVAFTPRAAWALSTAFALLVACGSERITEERASTADAAATVDGEPISLSEVARLSEATGLTPRRALARLIAERLLARRAEELGYGELPSVQREVARARVRALLAEAVEAKVPAEDVDGRARRLAELLAELRRGTRVRFDPRGVEAALALELTER